MFVRPNPSRYGLLIVIFGLAMSMLALAGLSRAETIPFRIEIGKAYEIMPGDTARVNVIKTGGDQDIHGYDLFIGYDLNILTFVEVVPGVLYDIPGPYEWEYFSYRNGVPSCPDTICPSGVIRAVSLSDMLNGSHHPVLENIIDGTILFTMKFLVPSDPALNCTKFPLRFFWHDCGDNGISYPDSGFERFSVSNIITDLQGINITDSLVDFPTLYGAPETCIVTSAPHPAKRFTDFVNGGVSVYCPNPPSEGDINLNGLAYEVGDGVLFADYFLKGQSVFTIDLEAQIAATDIKTDQIPLTLEDYVYLLRVINGVLPPWYSGPPPMTTEKFNGLLSITETDSSLIIRTDFDDSVSAMQICFYAPGLSGYRIKFFSDIDSTLVAGNLTDDSLKILIADSLETAHATVLDTGILNVLELVYTGPKPVFVHASAAGFWAQHVNLIVAALPNNPPVFVNPPEELRNDFSGGFHYIFTAQDQNTPPDLIEYHIVSGPGEINPLTGKWFYYPLCLDSGTTLMLELCASDIAHPCPQPDSNLHAFVRIVVDSAPPLLGDVDSSGVLNIADVTYDINFIYKNGPAPLPVPEVADVNSDGLINIRDITYMINYLYKNGAAPRCPSENPPMGYLTGHSDCKAPGPAKALADSLNEDCLTYQYDGFGTLILKHINALFNCCPLFIANVYIQGNEIIVEEFDSLDNGGCDCVCPFDMDYRIDNLPAGQYTIRVIEPYVPQGDPVLEFPIDLNLNPVGYYCVDRPWLPWVAGK
ncbi:MAG: dockerin type I domain-containing protein [candidate division Zixibacteria bacterium]|nr:dockerin type I domain-containing protein [candidate division Zixibacteria bacterium]